MTPFYILSIIAIYFSVLIIISRITGKDDDNDSFFLGKRQSPWYVVAFGMIGASLSGVTFISVPGWVESTDFGYMQMVLGYLVGYFVIATVLLPLYYRLQLTSIYTYLGERFGPKSYKTGASFFILSRVIGASFRLFLVANVLQATVFDSFGIPFAVTVAFTILLIWLYTFRSGIKTIIWTDTLQTFFMLAAVVLVLFFIAKQMNFEQGLWQTVHDSPYSRIFFFDDIKSSNYFWKQFIGGAFIAIVMTGLDQDMMQKNLSCKTLKEAQKNVFWFSTSLIGVNYLFLMLGVVLLLFAQSHNMDVHGDALFPTVATQGGLGIGVATFFILGLVASAYSSADSALTSLTTSYCVDILGTENLKKHTRKLVHVGFSLLLFIVIVLFKYVVDESVIKELFTAAGYTYGPLLGLYTYGLFTKRQVYDPWVPYIAVAAPILSYLLQYFSSNYWGYQFGFELLLVNGAITLVGLWWSQTFNKRKLIY